MNFDAARQFKENALGTARSIHKYVQRFGSPGHYTYIYPTGGIANASRQAKLAYKRHLHKQKRFLRKIQKAFSDQSARLRPKSWTRTMMLVSRRDGINAVLHVDLAKHKIIKYRLQKPTGGKWTVLHRAKKNGMLRYR